MIIKKLILIALSLACAACASVEQKKSAPHTIADYFPLHNHCSLIYRLNVHENGKKFSGDYMAKIVAADGNSGMIMFGDQTTAYTISSEGIFNTTKGYFILKDLPAGSRWQIPGGTAEITAKDSLLKLDGASLTVITVKETFPEKEYYTLASYSPETGLVQYEVYIKEGNSYVLSSAMVLKSYICSDQQLDAVGGMQQQ